MNVTEMKQSSQPQERPTREMIKAKLAHRKLLRAGINPDEVVQEVRAQVIKKNHNQLSQMGMTLNNRQNKLQVLSKALIDQELENNNSLSTELSIANRTSNALEVGEGKLNTMEKTVDETNTTLDDQEKIKQSLIKSLGKIIKA